MCNTEYEKQLVDWAAKDKELRRAHAEWVRHTIAEASIEATYHRARAKEASRHATAMRDVDRDGEGPTTSEDNPDDPWAHTELDKDK